MLVSECKQLVYVQLGDLILRGEEGPNKIFIDVGPLELNKDRIADVTEYSKGAITCILL